ncbi:DNA polymerase III subunit alpha [Luteibacter rhizovicinus DSM 16549]|uniref:DNA polymerase III subunit alpha n=1 Tax=Luteibacter rhizovicinus DSM 16549 TaxID=1440763 RepID=A0A0G9HFB0_9GAMM|nr:DNA polymerase III subunit alpha [Luteibacter rhizovicinus]APG04660.1 DNA polymerase III subunit alpha [Luteibacter rhizovicinus DSM 16549]KLD68151.1 DNA polymerase III subunit alpha [Luteibacter rhizovicinus DSM 16549]
MSVRFAHLHLHSEYSLVDSTIRIKQLVAACVRTGMPAVALTDENNLFGLVKFYKQCTAAGIKPIAGCDVWVSSPDDPRPWRLTLMCQDRDGYLNLSRLVSRAWREGQGTGRALVDATWMHPESVRGLIAVVGRESELARVALGAGLPAAGLRLESLRRLFPDRLYLELTRTGRQHEEDWVRAAMALAGDYELPVIASNDVRFLEREGFESHEARTCINQGRVLADPKRPHDYSEEQYFKSAEEMEALFADIPEALENTVELAKRCNLELTFGEYFLPNFPVPEGHTLDTFIRAQAQAGLEERLAVHPLAAGKTREDYQARLDREVDVIIGMGFPGYFLIVADFIGWGKDNGIPVGPGRGSGAGSLVAWVLKITDLDPLQFELLFERFLNPERVSMPDFDIDFCMDRRDEVIDYVARKYGRDHVSQIITYGSMAAKAVLRDSGRVLGMGYGQVDRLAKLIPNRPLDLTLGDALGRTEKSKKEPDRIVKEFCDVYEQEEEPRQLIDLALSLEGLTRNAGKHAGGVVIAPTPLTDFAPLYCEASGEGVVTQYDKDDVEAVGLVKFDFLGLRTLTIIDWAVKAINKRRAKEGTEALVIEALPLDDPKVYDLLKKAQTVAVFQLESRGMQGMLKDAQADRFEDIIALVALYRPGPMDLIPSFCARKHGREAVEYPDPRVEPILKETYGIMVYQEQVMQMAQIVGGYTLGGADLLRRAMGKKKAEEMVKHRATFREGAAKDGIDSIKADAIFDLMEKFAGYGFNKSHAAAYALVSYQTAWLKAHYPAEFMAATISSDMDNTEKAVTFLEETRTIGIKVLPPDVNASDWMFEAVEPKVVRYGLGAIKGVGQGICEEIVAERKAKGPYRGLVDFCQRVGSNKLNKRTMEALVQSGALDGLGENRATLVMHLPEAMRAADQEAKNRASGQVDIFGNAFGAAETPSIIELSGAVPEWPLEQLLQGEHDTLGHYLSGHPTDPWKGELAQLSSCPIGEIPQRYQPPKPRRNDDDENASRFRRGPETPWTVAGMVVGMRKRGDSDAFVQIEDATGLLETSFFREVFTEAAPLLTRGTLIVVEGGLRIDDFAGGYQLRARKAYALSDAMEHFGRLLTLRLNGIGPDFPQHLRQALMAYRGGRTPLMLSGYRNDTGQASFELGEAWRVRALPDLMRTLRALPGVLGTELRLVRPAD